MRRWLLAAWAIAPSVCAPQQTVPPARADGSEPWQLFVHNVPYRTLGVSASAEARYHAMISADPPPAHDEGGLYHEVIRELPRIMPPYVPRRAAGQDQPAHAARVLFLLPASPYHLCKATDMADVAWGQVYAVPKGAIPLSIQRSIIDAMGNGLANYAYGNVTCPTYERVLKWLFATAEWRAAPERHVFPWVMSHLLRVSLEADMARYREPRSLYAKMGQGILVTAEDRRRDWRGARACGHVVLAPYYSPSFFMHPEVDMTRLQGQKPALVVSSNVVTWGKKSPPCHRFDIPHKPQRWGCEDERLQEAHRLRGIVSWAVNNLTKSYGARAVALQTYRSVQQYASSALENTLRRKAETYKASTFCVIPAGDSAITTRIFSIIAALCIPVFVIDLDFLPFPSDIDWASMSIQVPSQQFLLYQRDLNKPSTVNPLLFLQSMERYEPDKILRLRTNLERARWHLLYHQDGRGVPVQGAAARPSAGHALVRELERAAARRLQLTSRSSMRASGAVLNCTRRVDPAHVP